VTAQQRLAFVARGGGKADGLTMAVLVKGQSKDPWHLPPAPRLGVRPAREGGAPRRQIDHSEGAFAVPL
jgi:hypothetical protein